MDKYVIVKYNSYGIPLYLHAYDKNTRERMYAVSSANALLFFSKRNAGLVKELMVSCGDLAASVELFKG